MISQPSLDPSSLSFDLPDPEQDDLSNIDFIERLENAWSICEQFDLQTEFGEEGFYALLEIEKKEVVMAEVLVFCSG